MKNISELAPIVSDGRKIFDKVELVESELGPKVRETEARKAKAKDQLAAAQKAHEAARAGYFEAWAKVEADEKRAIEAKALQLEDVESGAASMSDYLKRGEDAAAIAAQAKAAADRKLAELASIVRTKATAVLAAEMEVADIEAELAYLYGAGGILLITAVKEFVKDAEGRVAQIGGGYFFKATVRDQKKTELAEVQGQATHKGCREWHDLDPAGLRALRLDPAILESMLATLAEAIARAAASGELCDVRALYSPNGSGERLEVSWQRRTFEIGIKT